MQDKILGQKRAMSLLIKLTQDSFQGRTLIFHGETGVGKFSTALEFTRLLLNKNPFLSPDFLFFRNDNFSLKTRFFIKNIDNPNLNDKFIEYFSYLLGRISQSVALDEIVGKKKFIQDLRLELEELILNNKLKTALASDKKLEEHIIEISDDVSKKKRVPINFIRNIKEFNSQKTPASHRISLIGNFENATKEAQNSALKLLEEPPASSIIILTVANINALLPTILSRSIIIKFNPLTPAIIKNIFGDNPHNFTNTIDYIENKVYNYSEIKKAKVIEFWKNIAPNVQHNIALFDFVDDLTAKDSNNLALKFLEEIINYFRALLFIRQQNLRNINPQDFISSDYTQINPQLIRNTNTAEIEDMVKQTDEVIGQIKYGNVSAKTALPGLLINFARWYQVRGR